MQNSAMMMAAPIDVPAGQQLAPNGQITTRQMFMRKLTDIVVLPLGKVSGNERAFAADILIRTMQSAETPIRAEVSHRLAGISDIPRHLLRWLILDDIEVAEPLLHARIGYDESLLMEAAECSYKHRWLIKHRDDITSAIADVLVRHSETDILRHLLGNHDIRLSEQSMESLIERSRTDASLRDLLLRRLELRIDQAFIMYWWMDTAQRKHLLKRFMTDRSVIQEAMHELFVVTFTSETPDLLVKSSLKLIDRRHRPRGRNGEMVTMDIVQTTLTAARCQPTHEFTHAVGLLAGISQETSQRALFDASGESFAILCKSIGLSRGAFREIISDNRFAEPDSVAILTEEKIEDLVGVFDSISRDFSRTILRYWDWKSDVLAATGELAPGEILPDKQNHPYFGAL